jgi:hypothetical protein
MDAFIFPVPRFPDAWQKTFAQLKFLVNARVTIAG